MGKRIVAAVGSGDVGAVHRHARLGQPAAAHRRRRKGDQGLGQADHDALGRNRCRRRAGAVGDRSLVPEPQKRQGHVRRRRRQHGIARQSHAEARPAPRKGVKAGGFDLTEQTQKLLKEGNIEFTIDQQPYLQGFLPVLQLFLYKVSGLADRPRGNRHGPQVPRQGNGHSVRQLEVPLRGNVHRGQGGPVQAGRPAEQRRERGREPAAPTRNRRRRGRARRRLAPGRPRGVASGCSSARSALREGSIIVVTIIVAIYFSANTSTFFTGANFKTLLPYFAPLAILGAGEVFVMILGEIDLSIGAMYMFAPIVFYKLDTAGLGLVPCADPRAARSAWPSARSTASFVAIVGVNSFVTTLGHAVHVRGAQPDPLPRHARGDARSPGPPDDVQRPPRRQRAQHRAPGKGQPRRDVRENLRRWHLLRADLGGGDRAWCCRSC